MKTNGIFCVLTSYLWYVQRYFTCEVIIRVIQDQLPHLFIEVVQVLRPWILKFSLNTTSQHEYVLQLQLQLCNNGLLGSYSFAIEVEIQGLLT